MHSQLSFEDFKVWLTELPDQDNKFFIPGSNCNCPIAVYASARIGEPCWVAYDQISKIGLPMEKTDIILRATWVLEVVSIVDTETSPLSAKEVLALI